MADLALVTYCGLYCGLCSERGRIPQQASALRALMAKEGYESWGADQPGFTEFWAFLSGLCDPDGCCPGCRAGGGPPFCGIRKCARGREVEICPLCDDYPCSRVEMLAEGYPTLLADGKRLQAVGLEAWIAEQVERSKTGFVYVDIRYHPYSIPEEWGPGGAAGDLGRPVRWRQRLMSERVYIDTSQGVNLPAGHRR